jgi:lysophospholipase L1-like esterase
MIPVMTNRRTNLLVAAVTTIACIGLLEISAGIIFKHAPKTNGKRLVLSALSSHEQFVGVNDSYIIPHPYMLYTPRPGFDEFGYRQINSLGYRGHEFTQEKPDGTYRVLCLGGSTTLSYPYIKDPERAWPALIETRLNELYPGRRFEVINAGLGYATSAELLAGYMFRHRYLQPDMVVIHEGGNDTDPLMFENYNPEYTHFRAPGVRVMVGHVERLLLRSNLFRLFYAHYWRYVPSIYTSQPYGFDLLSRKDALQRVQNTYPLGFERNIDLIIRTAQADGAKVLLAGFVAERGEQFTKAWPSMRGLEPAIMLGLQKNLQVMEGLGKKYGVLYLSPSEVDFKGEWFIDGCHLTEEGERVKADWILGGIIRTMGEMDMPAPHGPRDIPLQPAGMGTGGGSLH